ncbi:hypothetical protein PRBEI_2000794000 [Prionailurus iriomotensis]
MAKLYGQDEKSCTCSAKGVMLHITHRGGSSLMKTAKFDFENYSEKFKPRYLPL